MALNTGKNSFLFFFWCFTLHLSMVWHSLPSIQPDPLPNATLRKGLLVYRLLQFSDPAFRFLVMLSQQAQDFGDLISFVKKAGSGNSHVIINIYTRWWVGSGAEKKAGSGEVRCVSQVQRLLCCSPVLEEEK